MWRSLFGSVKLELTGADIASTINAIINAGICLSESNFCDELTIQFSVKRTDFRKVRKICLSRGDQLRILHLNGVYWSVKSALKRPVLLLGLVFFFTLSIYLPTRVLFVRVEGNKLIPNQKILETASHCGINFGSSRQNVRSEKVKNALLGAMPELQWVGVNTSGCVAIVSVKEREPSATNTQGGTVSSIVAAREGVITECTVTRGNPSCKVGQAVQKGQVLISGYTDCGLSIRAVQAEGEVYAQTQREIMLSSPKKWLERSTINGSHKKYGLIFGKKRINFYKGSGISDSSCVKMYEESYITLPGGFVLPVAFITETYIDMETDEMVQTEDQVIELLKDLSNQYLSSQMIAGKILSREETVIQEDEVYRINGRYICQEMIGIVRNEEIIKPYGKHD